jgi:hypothetical protein
MGSVLDPDLIRQVDPDSEFGTRSRIHEGKTDPQK